MKQERWQALFGVDGKIAVVADSGALSSTDIGLLLAEAGATVVIADRDAGDVQALVERITASGGKSEGIVADIEREADVIRLFEEVRARFGRLDILVNCPGLMSNQPLTETTVEQWDDSHSVNTRSVFLCMREGVKLMLDSGGGRIVNVTTIGSLHPVLRGNAAYSASRAGVTMLTRTAALDYVGDNILVNAVLPGAIESKVRFHHTAQARLEAGYRPSGPIFGEGRNPLGYLEGVDIARAVLWLVGPAGRMMTGQMVALDSGFLVT